jgi:hypothetical protein
MKVSNNITTFSVNGKKIFTFKDCVLYCSVSMWVKQGICLKLFKSIALKKNVKNLRNFYSLIYNILNIKCIIGNYPCNFPNQVHNLVQ